MIKIVIYGGGNIAHATAASIATHQQVTILTHHPADWNQQLEFTKDGQLGTTAYKINATSEVGCVKDADIVFITVPQYAYENALAEIEHALKPGSSVVFMPAPAKAADYASRLSNRGINVVGFQRVPNVSRIITHGKSVTISANRPSLRLALTNSADRAKWRAHCALWFGASVDFLSSFLIFKFSNSNPLLHPSRMAVLFDNWRNRTYSTNPFFYAEWTDESSELYLAADDEMAKLVAEFPEIDPHDYISARRHYGIATPSELTAKLRSIPGLHQIRSPMKQMNDVWVPDFSSRYFTEDIDYGLKAIADAAQSKARAAPTILSMCSSIAKIRT